MYTETGQANEEQTRRRKRIETVGEKRIKKRRASMRRRKRYVGVRSKRKERKSIPFTKSKGNL
jgi:hypothetical protein